MVLVSIKQFRTVNELLSLALSKEYLLRIVFNSHTKSIMTFIPLDFCMFDDLKISDKCINLEKRLKEWLIELVECCKIDMDVNSPLYFWFRCLNYTDVNEFMSIFV